MPATLTCFPAEGLSFKTYVGCVSQGMETEGKNDSGSVLLTNIVSPGQAYFNFILNY